MAIEGIGIGVLCGVVGYFCGLRAPLGEVKRLQDLLVSKASELDRCVSTFIRIESKRQELWKKAWEIFDKDVHCGNVQFRGTPSEKHFQWLKKIMLQTDPEAMFLEPKDYPPVQ